MIEMIAAVISSGFAAVSSMCALVSCQARRELERDIRGDAGTRLDALLSKLPPIDLNWRTGAVAFAVGAATGAVAVALAEAMS